MEPNANVLLLIMSLCLYLLRLEIFRTWNEGAQDARLMNLAGLCTCCYSEESVLDNDQVCAFLAQLMPEALQFLSLQKLYFRFKADP